jgi:hypothetical protein
MSKPIENHVMVMRDAGEYRRDSYGVLYQSCLVYDTTKSHAPTRLDVWSNTDRPYNEDRATWNTRGKGFKYLDPHNNGTDDEVSFILSPESSVICSDTSRNTGQPGSGQVYAEGERLGEGDTATLVYPDWTIQRVVLHFTNNGHGIATATTPREVMRDESPTGLD